MAALVKPFGLPPIGAVVFLDAITSVSEWLLKEPVAALSSSWSLFGIIDWLSPVRLLMIEPVTAKTPFFYCSFKFLIAQLFFFIVNFGRVSLPSIRSFSANPWGNLPFTSVFFSVRITVKICQTAFSINYFASVLVFEAFLALKTDLLLVLLHLFLTFAVSFEPIA